MIHIKEMPYIQVGHTFFDLKIEDYIHKSDKDVTNYIKSLDKTIAKELLQKKEFVLAIQRYKPSIWKTIKDYLESL